MNGYVAAGVVAIVLVIVALLVGVGFRRLAGALAAAVGLALVAAVVMGVFAGGIAMALDKHKSEFSGLAALGVGAVTGLIVFVGGFFTVMIVAAIRWKIFQRGAVSAVWLGVGWAVLVLGVAGCVFSQPRYTATRRLVQQVGTGQYHYGREVELVRRGRAVVPAILAEIHRHSLERSDHNAPSQVPPLLRVLGRIGGPEANAEVHRWAEAKGVYENIRVAALVALAEQGDASAGAMIGELLADGSDKWRSHYYQLLPALGKLKAADQVRAIRQLLMRKHEYSTPVYVGINALVAIGTDEAWAAIAEVASSAERSVRCEVMNAFQGKGGARTVALAAKVLDDPEPSVRLAAYWAVYHVEPKLFAGLPGTYSEDNVATLKTLLRDREPTTP